MRGSKEAEARNEAENAKLTRGLKRTVVVSHGRDGCHSNKFVEGFEGKRSERRR